MWTYCTSSLVWLQTSMGTWRDLWHYQCLEVCVNVINFSPETSVNIQLGLGVNAGSKLRRIILITLWSFPGWQMIAGPLAAISSMKLSGSGGTNLKPVSHWTLLCLIKDLNLKNVKGSKERKSTWKYPLPTTKPGIIRPELHVLHSYNLWETHSMLRLAGLYRPGWHSSQDQSLLSSGGKWHAQLWGPREAQSTWGHSWSRTLMAEEGDCLWHLSDVFLKSE